MTLRRFGSRSFGDLKSDQALKSLIRSELKEMINNSIHEYMQKTKVPVATIDISVDKNCKDMHYNSPNDTGRNVRLNISNSSVEISPDYDKKDEETDVIAKDDDNLHWMAWRTFDKKPVVTKSYAFRDSRCQTPTSAHRYRCSSPFSRPNTATGPCNKSEEYKVTGREFGYGQSCIRRADAPKIFRSNSTMALTRPRTSVAVGPDKHFEETGTNTQRSYQFSDYLKKSMNLNDPYERSVYSTLMEIMRKKSHCGVDLETGIIDPIVQISEYKHKYQNPGTKITFPTSSTHTLVTVKKPPICPHKSRPLGQLRPQTASTSLLRTGEQFLF